MDNANLQGNRKDGFVLVDGFSYYLACNPILTINFKSGLRFNGASVPLLLTWLIPRYGDTDKACMIHDFIYQTKLISRRLADKEFLHIMKHTDVPRWKRYSMYCGVRMCGWIFYYDIDRWLKSAFRFLIV